MVLRTGGATSVPCPSTIVFGSAFNGLAVRQPVQLFNGWVCERVGPAAQRRKERFFTETTAGEALGRQIKKRCSSAKKRRSMAEARASIVSGGSNISIVFHVR